MTKQENNVTLKDAFIGKIAGQILNGDLKPGDRLPSERELAQKEGISRSIVHLALSDLERMRFVETSARHGTYIGDYIKNGNIETLNLLIRLNGTDFNTDRIQDLLEMRLAIEGKAIELLIVKMESHDIDVLQKDIDKAEKTAEDTDADDRSLAACLFDFHHDICVLSGNFILPLLFNTFEYVTLAYWEKAIRHLGREKSIDLLEGFLRVLETKDAKKCENYLRQEFEIYMERIVRDA